MRKTTMFLNLISANLKRMRNYIIPILVSVLILLSVCSAAGVIISGNIYKEQSFSTISLAYYLPDDDDKKYNLLALGMLEEMRSMQETAKLIQVANIEDGYRMLDNGDVLFFIIVPDNFFSGIMDSTNPPLDIIVRDNASVPSYIANELFMSYARYLGIAQAGIYSALDTVRSHELDSEQIYDIQDKVNLIYLDRSLNKDSYIETTDATGEGNFSLKQHYIAVAVMLTLFFMTFMIAPLIQKYDSGMILQLESHNLNAFHIFLSNYICTICTLYIAYIPCWTVISIWQKKCHPIGLLSVIPCILIIALIINLINVLCNNTTVNHMVLLAVTLGITYIGGGILPSAMLPEIVQRLSTHMPGAYLISTIGHSIFGL